MKRLTYITTDLLNATTAETLGKQHGLDVQVLVPRDLDQADLHEIDLIVDWDFLPDDYRTMLLSNPEVNVVAIHGYGISESLADLLPRQGVHCGTRLDQYFAQTLTPAEWAA